MWCSVTLLIVLSFAAVHADPCNLCPCSEWKGLRSAKCRELQSLTSVTNTDSSTADIELLDIRYTPVASLVDSQFISFTNLKVLGVIDCEINNIQNHAFRNLLNVTEISLANNSIATLPTDLFEDTPNLNILNLYNNKLTVIQNNLFSNLKFLSEIYLGKNYITTIEKNSFAKDTLLKKLYLGFNNLQRLHINPAILSSLQDVIMYGNLWHCNTLLCEVMNFTISRDMYGVYPIPTCTTPRYLQGEPWDEVHDDLCKNYSPSNCVDNLTGAECIDPAVYAASCSPCECSETKSYLSLECYSQESLTSVPNTGSLPADIDKLVIKNSPITSLVHSQFISFTKLKVIHIEDCKVKDVQSHAFRNMLNVTKIVLSHNLIDTLPTDLFEDTPNVAKIILTDNKLTTIQKNLFSNLKSLIFLALDNNYITIIEKNSISDVPLLEKLFLKGNKLQSLHLNPVILSSLQILTLDENPWHCNTALCEVMNATISLDQWDIYVYSIPTCITPEHLKDEPWNKVKEDLCGACSPCRCVDITVDITVAECSDVLPFPSIPDTLPQHITSLRVTDQELTVLEENQFAHLNQLQEMFLIKNKITTLHPKTFKNLINLTWLALTDNSITQLHKDTFSFTPKLIKLSLNNNNLTALHKFQFSNLPLLQELDFSYNQIDFIDDNCFINVSSLQTINLSFNNLKKLQLSIIDNTNSLKDLYLNGNPWQCDDSLCEVMNAVVSGRIWTGDNNPTCAAPQKLKGKQWHQIYDYFQPRIISNISSVEEGHDITLQCKYCFVSNVMWIFNGIKLSRNMQQVSDTGLLSTLTVKSARQEEQGYYACHVGDCWRCEDAWRYVKVEGKDTVDTKKVCHIAINSTDKYTRHDVIHLSCTILEDEGQEDKN